MPKEYRRPDAATSRRGIPESAGKARAFGSNADRLARLNGGGDGPSLGKPDYSLVKGDGGFAPRDATVTDEHRGGGPGGDDWSVTLREKIQQALVWMAKADERIDRWGKREENWDDRMVRKDENQKDGAIVWGKEHSSEKSIGGTMGPDTRIWLAVELEDIKTMVDARTERAAPGELAELIEKIREGDMEGVYELTEKVTEFLEALAEQLESEEEGGESQDEEATAGTTTTPAPTVETKADPNLEKVKEDGTGDLTPDAKGQWGDKDNFGVSSFKEKGEQGVHAHATTTKGPADPLWDRLMSGDGGKKLVDFRELLDLSLPNDLNAEAFTYDDGSVVIVTWSMTRTADGWVSSPRELYRRFPAGTVPKAALDKLDAVFDALL